MQRDCSREVESPDSEGMFPDLMWGKGSEEQKSMLCLFSFFIFIA